jgi:hypothetical protein
MPRTAISHGKSTRAAPNRHASDIITELAMLDLYWIALILALLALSVGYVGLADKA